MPGWLVRDVKQPVLGGTTGAFGHGLCVGQGQVQLVEDAKHLAPPNIETSVN